MQEGVRGNSLADFHEVRREREAPHWLLKADQPLARHVAGEQQNSRVIQPSSPSPLSSRGAPSER